MPRLSVLQGDPVACARLTAALGSEHQLRFSPRWSHLLDSVSARSIDGAIIDIYDGPEPVPMAALRRFRQRHPGLAVIVYSDFEGREFDLFQVGRIGANAIVLPGRGDSHDELRQVVDDALAEAIALRVGYALRGDVRTGVLRIVRWAVAHAHRNPRAREISSAFGVGHETLNRRLRRAGLPTAGPLLVWAKLLRAGHWLQDRDRNVEGVAYQLGYSSGTAFRRALKRYTGATPTEVGDRGGLGFVLERFRDRALGPPPDDDTPPGDR